MIKVIVVEDEPPILDAVAKMIEQTNSNFKVIGKALNGEDALPLIKTHKPDVVFVDVNMPVMDGLALIENLSTIKPTPISVMLSGYKEFEYARKALKYGALDYLVKPLNLDILEDLLNNIFKRLFQIKKTREIEALEKIMESSILISLNKATLDLATDIFNFKKYICILLCAGSTCSYHSSSLTPGKEFWASFNLESLLMENIIQPDSFWVVDEEHGNEKIILIGSNINSEDKLSNIPGKVLKLLGSADISIVAVASKIFNEIKLFGSYVQKLQIILKKNIPFGFSRIIIEDELEQVKKRVDEEIMNSSWESFFRALIINGEKEGFKQNLVSLLALCESKHCRQFILEKVLQQIFSLFYNVQELKPSDKLIDIHMELNEIISCSTSYQLLQEDLSYLSDDLFDNYAKAKVSADSQDEIINRIEEYIKSNYTKPINLQTLSDMFCFVPQYLGRKYKKIKSITPNDFIMHLRIEKAKELLQIAPHIPIKDIAESVGYEDPFYMSRIFKVITGKSPSEFKITNSDFPV